MKILILGGGGREHAIAWKLKREGHSIVAAPGNPGIANLGEYLTLDIKNPEVVADYVAATGIDFTVVGPEAPLACGIVDCFNVRGLPIFGPTKPAAEIETSKSFCCGLLAINDVPIPRTKAYRNFRDLKKYGLTRPLPFVIKKDGLAAGKGVEVVRTAADLDPALERLGKMSDDVFLVQDMVEGPEISFFVLTDGVDFVFLGSAQDYKPLFKGSPLNTGGMGGFAPHYLLTSELRQTIEDTIVRSTIEALAAAGRPYQGCLYFQLMITKDGPVVIEINARFGDPETQLLMPLLDCDLAAMLQATTKPGTLRFFQPRFRPEKAVAIVLASEGYPGTPEVGKVISGHEVAAQVYINRQPSAFLFHAGTAKGTDNQLITAGGRVFTAVGRAPNYAYAKLCARIAAFVAKFEGEYHREDIADEAIKATL